jgi:uncharacterized protein YcgI (DUF1989 family)
VKNDNRLTIKPQTGIGFTLDRGKSIRVIDVEGQQVADLIAVSRSDPREILSTGATLDCNSSLRVEEGKHLYSNYYHEMFMVVRDEVGMHDILYPACSLHMYRHQYGIFKEHPSCRANLACALAGYGITVDEIPNPFNIFMHTVISQHGRISVKEPLSKPGDFIELRADMELIVAISACSVVESKCNGYRCTSIEIERLP